MNTLQSLLVVSPFAYGVIVSVVLSMLIGYKNFTINRKNFYIAILCYLPILILATVIAFVIPNSTPEGSLVVVKVMVFILPFIWALLPVSIQISFNRQQKAQQEADGAEQSENN